MKIQVGATFTVNFGREGMQDCIREITNVAEDSGTFFTLLHGQKVPWQIDPDVMESFITGSEVPATTHGNQKVRIWGYTVPGDTE